MGWRARPAMPTMEPSRPVSPDRIPHMVAMARGQLGRKRVYLDEMVQACMVMLRAAKPLPWN